MNAIKDQHGRIWKFNLKYTDIVLLMAGSGSKAIDFGIWIDGKFVET